MKNKFLLIKLIVGLAGLVAITSSHQLELSKTYAENVNISNEENKNDQKDVNTTNLDKKK